MRADLNLAGGEPSLDLKGTDTNDGKWIRCRTGGNMGSWKPTAFLGYGPELRFANQCQILPLTSLK